MKKIVIGVAAALTVGLFGLNAFATEGESQFQKADTNKDGVISWVEAVAYYPKATEAEFAQADVNGNGSLTAEEMDTLSNLIYPNPLSPSAQIDQKKRNGEWPPEHHLVMPSKRTAWPGPLRAPAAL